MGPVWMHASHISGMPIQSRIWMEDPPASSYPACIGVKCAEMQSKEAGEKYLRLLREAVMMEGRNIAKHDILIEQAEKLNIHLNAFNLNLFKHYIKGDKAIEAFRTDLNEVKYRSIDRFPTLIFRAKGQPSVIITGYRHYEILSSIMYKMIPGIIRESLPLDKDVYKETWGSITQRELNECYSTPLS
jgi:predicted DsbA family dithiol-disulfide isomerase